MVSSHRNSSATMSMNSTTAVRPEYNPHTERYEVQHDPDGSWSVSTTVVLSLSSLTDDDPTEMRPLGRVIDATVLERHLDHDSPDATVTFQYHDHDVTVRDDGRVELTPLRERETEQRKPQRSLVDDTTDSGEIRGDGSGGESYKAHYESGRDRPSIALVEAIAAMKGTDPMALEPLGNSIDMDALDDMLQYNEGDRSVEMTIPSHGVQAAIDGDGTIELQRTVAKSPDSERAE